jgi:hypothetical protein
VIDVPASKRRCKRHRCSRLIGAPLRRLMPRRQIGLCPTRTRRRAAKSLITASLRDDALGRLFAQTYSRSAVSRRAEIARIVRTWPNRAVPAINPSEEPVFSAEDSEYTAALRALRDSPGSRSIAHVNSILLEFITVWPVHRTTFRCQSQGSSFGYRALQRCAMSNSRQLDAGRGPRLEPSRSICTLASAAPAEGPNLYPQVGLRRGPVKWLSIAGSLLGT